MNKILITLSILVSNLIVSFSQENANYSIMNKDGKQYLVYGRQFPISFSKNNCLEYIEDNYISEGKRFIIIHILDEMNNNRGVVIFDKQMGQVDYSPVQLERKKYYKYYQCCIYVSELNGLLYFWDIKESDKEDSDYDCQYDSQTDASGHLIPRYYIFNTETRKVNTVFLKNNCSGIIENGRIVCD